MAFSKEKAIERAEKLAAKGQHDKAAREYQSVVDNDPKDIRAWLMLADCLVRCGERAKAIDRYLKVAQFYAEQKQPQKAVAVYRQVIGLDGSRLDVHLKVASLNRSLGRTGDAVATYEMVAQAQIQAGRTKDAIEAFRMAADADPTSVSKRLRVAELYSREGMVDRAVESFRAAATTLLQQDRREDYLRVAERLLYHRKNDVDTLRDIARVYVAMGDPRRALMKLNALLHAQPNDVVGLELLADTFGALDKLDKAVSVAVELARALERQGPQARQDLLRVLDKGMTWDPNNPDLARIRLDAGTTEPVEDAPSDRIEELDVDDAEVVEIGEDDVVIEDLDDDDGDEPSLTQTILEEVSGEQSAADPDQLDDLDKVVYEARVYVKYRLYEHALDHLSTALERDPEHLAALALQARALTELGRKTEAAATLVALARQVMEHDPKAAREHLRAAIDLVPDHREARDLLGGEVEEGAPRIEEVPISIDTDALDIDDSAFEEIQTTSEFSRAPRPLLAAEDEVAFDELEDLDTGIVDIRLPDQGAAPLTRGPDDEADFAIELQEGETQAEAVVTRPISIENRFGLSEAGPLPTEVNPLTVEPEGGWPDLADEIAEVRFFADQGLDEDARFALDELVRQHPDHPEVIALQKDLGSGPESVDDGAARPLLSLAGEEEEEDAYLAAIFSDEASQPTTPKKKEVQIGATAQLEDADAGTYFDLGTAYREMGLVDDAITQFEQAARDHKWRAKALVMLGTLRVHRGETEQAIADLRDAIAAGRTPDELSEARYELSLVYGKVGDTGTAIELLEQVPAGYRDRNERLEELRGEATTGTR